MKHIPLFLLLILILTSCSQRTVKKKVIYEPEPEKIHVIIPKTIPKIIPGIIPESIIQKAEKKYDMYARNRYKAFNTMLRKIHDSSTEIKLKKVNKFFNNVPYAEDMKIWGRKNYWATPLEFLGQDNGDCEDYVFAKYFTLRSLGVDSKKLCISYVRSIRVKKIHMVLSYFKTPYSIPLILDSINYKIFPADKRDDLIPVYNFNGESLYHARQNGKNGKKINNKKVNKRWNRLVNDIKKNKL